MEKVIKFLNENATRTLSTGDPLHGTWTHRFGDEKRWVNIPEHLRPINRLRCSLNNKTLTIDIILDGKLSGLYGYLQTYEHIPRGEPDKWGYYRRSTEEEIIKYLTQFYFRHYKLYLLESK